MLKKIVIALVLIFWPLNLLFHNTFTNFIKYIFPIFEPKFAILPLIILVIVYREKLLKKQNLKKFIFAIFILIIFWKPFFGQTVFKFDYERGQQVIQKTHLYPNVFMARVFQNKGRIVLDKFANNFFALTDLNNYFFGFAPRQIAVENQNIKKFPFMSLPFLLLGLFHFNKMKHSKTLLILLVAITVNLSILTNFDRNDFILWLPLSLVIIHGANVLEKKFRNIHDIYILLFIIFTIPEFLRIFTK